MSTEKIQLKNIYRDALLHGHIEGSLLVISCGNRNRCDGRTEATVKHMSAITAERLAKKKGGYPQIANAIASIIYISTILYGEVGRIFLNEKSVENGCTFSQCEFSKAITKSILRNYKDEELKNIVIRGVNDALDNQNNIEANAAKAAIMINEYRFADLYSEANLIDEAYLNGETIKSEDLFRIMEKAKFGEFDCDEVMKKLNLLYDLLYDNIEKVVPCLEKKFEGLSREKTLIYFIAQLSIEEADRIITKLNK
jgi:hypothetical protein